MLSSDPLPEKNGEKNGPNLWTGGQWFSGVGRLDTGQRMRQYVERQARKMGDEKQDKK
jgi:hypothetical protein